MSNKLRIAFFHELPEGGARSATNSFAKELKKKHTVDLFYIDEKKDISEHRNYSKAYFYKFIPLQWKGKNWKIRFYKDSIELYKNWKLHKQIAQTINKQKYDVIFVNASKFIESPFLLRYLKTKSVFYLHDPYYRIIYDKALTFPSDISQLRKLYETGNRLIRKFIDKKNISKATYVFSNSKFASRQFLNIYHKNSVVKYIGIDTRFFIPKNMKRDIDVLYIGSRSSIDGYDLLIQILKLLPKNSNVRMVLHEDGMKSQSEIRTLYQRSKIVICLARKEPFGLIPLEAMSTQTPVIALKEGGYVETIKDNETGYLVSPNVKQIANRITYLLSHKAKRFEMGVAGRKWVLQNWNNIMRGKELEKGLVTIAYEK